MRALRKSRSVMSEAGVQEKSAENRKKSIGDVGRNDVIRPATRRGPRERLHRRVRRQPVERRESALSAAMQPVKKTNIEVRPRRNRVKGARTTLETCSGWCRSVTPGRYSHPNSPALLLAAGVGL